MPTSDTFVDLNMKRFLSQNRMENDLFEYEQEGRFDVLARIFPAAGLFTYPVVLTAVPGSFSMTPDPLEGCDNAGHVFIVTGASRLTAIPFENNPGDTYWVGFKYIEIPQGVYTNPRTGEFEYDLNVEEVGEKDDPSAVTDLTGTIRFNCNSIFEASITHAGRVVRVWLKNPMSGDDAVAFEDCTVTYDAGSGENRIVTTGTLGQTTVSVNATDYQIACLGCTVRKNATNPFGDEYLDIGSILGHAVTPTTNTTGVQLDLSGGGGHSLQAAYDGSAGSGSGRNILADYQAVEITQENDTVYEHDIFHANLRITCDTDKSSYVAPPGSADLEIGIDVTSRFFSYGAYVNRVNIGDYSGTGYLNNEETITVAVAGDTITFSRVGVDLTFPALYMALHPNAFWEVCEISNSQQGNDGVYVIGTTITSNTLQLLNLDGTAAALSLETATPGLTASIYRLAARYGYGFGGNALISTADIQRDISATDVLMRMVAPSGTSDSYVIFAVERYNAAGTVVTDYLRIYADGDVSSTKDFFAAGQFRSTTAAATYGLYVNAGDGYIGGDMEVGNDVLAGNNVEADNDMIINGGGQFTSIDSGGSLRVDANITSVNGNGSFLNGSVTANGLVSLAGVTCDSGDDFKYNAIRYFQTRYGGEDITSEWDSVNSQPCWAAFGSGATPPLMQITSLAPSPVGSRCYIPLHLPDDCELDYVYALVNSTSVGITMRVIKCNHDYSTPAIDNPHTSLGTVTATTTALEVIQITGIGDTIDNNTWRYFICFESTSVAGGDQIWDVRVRFRGTIFNPNAG